ncbi:MAG: CDP-alcohol phosphatidyltransferase family protein [Pseudomonadota bacterium]
MIDGLLKDVIDPFWEALARPLAKAGMTPNQVTAAGLVLIITVCGLYLWHGSLAIFGGSLALAFVFDALDGAVARQTGLSSKAGGYFDAMVDRYQELLVMAALGWGTGHWVLCFLGFSGAMMVSYAKARTAIETPISNTAWPDLFERLERVIFLCVLLVVAGVSGWPWLLPAGLGLYALLCHATALQRIKRAFSILNQIDKSRS